VHNNIKCTCFEEPEKQSIIKASEILASDFLNISNTFLEIRDRVEVGQYHTFKHVARGLSACKSK
jgi:hypothetical protein